MGAKNFFPLLKTLFSAPQTLLIDPSVLRFFMAYMDKFRIRRVGNYYILHSHLPPLNSPAYSRFVNEHIIRKSKGPSHAQIALTNICPQHCGYCYNRGRKGNLLSKDEILKTAKDLIDLGVVWLGFTGGEPLLNPDLVEIAQTLSGKCAVKIFTTGFALTPELASRLKGAGVFSVCVSLDHWEEQKHDRDRGLKGAFKKALEAIKILREVGIDVGVSAVLSPEMIREEQADHFLEFLEELGVDEAWLSETKPTSKVFWDSGCVISEDDRLKLVKLQDAYNKKDGITVNYLGHFEGRENFGCNAGNKMVYVDAFGDVSPCVFTPMRFGSIREESISQIFMRMKKFFPPAGTCFLNRNYPLFQKYSQGKEVLDRETSERMMKEVKFAPYSHFSEIFYKSGKGL